MFADKSSNNESAKPNFKASSPYVRILLHLAGFCFEQTKVWRQHRKRNTCIYNDNLTIMHVHFSCCVHT